MLQREDGAVLVVSGTAGYRGRGREASLRTLLADAVEDRLDWDEMLGAFVAVVWDGRRLTVFNDRLQVQPVFVDEAREVLSTSFLALAAVRGRRQRVNRIALLEKLTTGFIVGPDTLVEGITKANHDFQRGWAGRGWRYVTPPERSLLPIPSRHALSRHQAIEEQCAALIAVLKRSMPLATGKGAVLCASAGYDSRLLFAATQHLGITLKLQTHATEGVHDSDHHTVAEWARARQLQLIEVPTKHVEKLEGPDLDELAVDCVRFFDGRNSHNMGALSQVYTRGYSIASLGGAGLRFNGIGGELYRNYYHSSLPRVRLFDWMVHHVYYPPSRRIFAGREWLRELHGHVVAKMSASLGQTLGEKVDQLTLRRLYSEIRMPECDGVNSNAHNQIAFYLTPFIEWPVIRQGYRAISHLGLSGRFQADLIGRFDRQIAASPSHYGFPLDREPLSWVFRAAVKGMTPDCLWNLRMSLRESFRPALTRLGGAFALLERSPVLRVGFEELERRLPGVNLKPCLSDYAQGPNVLFVGVLLHELRPLLED